MDSALLIKDLRDVSGNDNLLASDERLSPSSFTVASTPKSVTKDDIEQALELANKNPELAAAMEALLEDANASSHQAEDVNISTLNDDSTRSTSTLCSKSSTPTTTLPPAH